MIERLRSAIDRKLFSGDVIESSPQHFEEQIAAAAGYDCLILGGGDGTISQALPALTKAAVPLGILPLGTANDLARELGVAKLFSLQAPEKLLLHYQTAAAKQLSIWRLSYGAAFERSLLFSNYVSLGFDGEVMDDVARWRRARPGLFKLMGVPGNRAAYILAGLRHLPSPPFHFTECRDRANNESLLIPSELRTLFIANIQSALGFGKSSSLGSPFDSTLELIALPSVFSYLSFVLPAIGPRLALRQVNSGFELRGVSPRTRFQADGEEKPELTGQDLRIVFERTIPVLCQSSAVL